MMRNYTIFRTGEIALWVRLEGISLILPNPNLFLYSYVRKEAVLSSQIEGTQSSLSDLLLFENKEAPGTPLADVREVSNYVAAINYGLERLRQDFPLSLEIKQSVGLEPFFRRKAPKLWGVGNPAILDGPRLGIISARQIDSDLALKSSQLLNEVAALKDVSFIGGWHAPLEEEALRILLDREASIVFCVSKSLHRFVPPSELESRVRAGDGLLLTHCSPKAKRISRDASVRRNQLIVGLATALLILSAPGGSATLNLAKSALRHGKSVLTPEHRMNKELLGYDALPATFDNIRTALG